MEYSYEIDSQNAATVTFKSDGQGGTVSQHNSPYNLMPWTKEDAEEWAEATIQAMKDNDDVYVAPVYNREEQIAAHKLAKQNTPD
jgi:hypothetical protein